MIRNIVIASVAFLVTLITIFFTSPDFTIIFLISLVFFTLLIKDPFYGFLFALYVFWTSFALNQYIHIKLMSEIFINAQVLTILILAILFFFIKYIDKLNIFFKKNKFIILPFMCFIIISSVSTFISLVFYNQQIVSVWPSLKEILNSIAWVTLFIISLFMFQNPQNRQKFVQYISIFIICISVIALIEYFTSYNFLKNTSPEMQMGLEDTIISINRATSVFDHPNSLGAFLALFFPLLMFYSLSENKLTKVIHPVIALTILPLALFVTFSRSSWITTILSALFMFLFYLKNKRFYLLLLPLLIGISGFFLLNESLSSNVTARIQTDTAVSYRMTLWKGLLRKIENKKIIGYGTSSVETYLSKQVIGTQMFAHNEHLKVLVENGYLGFAAYISIFLAFIVKYLNQWIKNKNPANIFALIVIFGYLLMATTTNTWYFKASFFFVILAFFDNVSSEQKGDSPLFIVDEE